MLPLLTYLTLTTPGTDGAMEVKPPPEIPTGGLGGNGAALRVIQNSITLFLVIIVFLSLFFIIYGGIRWITSGGDKNKLDSARKTLIYAVVGLVLAFLSFTIITFVGGLFGLNLIRPTLIFS